jgi:hypothetical protein
MQGSVSVGVVTGKGMDFKEMVQFYDKVTIVADWVL